MALLQASYALVALAGAAFGQGFSELATNGDGSILYFWSPLRIKGTDQYLLPQISTSSLPRWRSGPGILDWRISARRRLLLRMGAGG
jgi:hypothetical protein